MGREAVQVTTFPQRPWRHGLHPDPSWTPPPRKMAIVARSTLSSSRMSFPVLCCAARHHALAPCHVCQEPLGPCAGGVFGPTGRHASINPRIADELSSWAKLPGALRAERTTDHVVELVQLVRVRASSGQGIEKAKTEAGLDPKSRYDIVRWTCSRPRRRQRKGEKGPLVMPVRTACGLVRQGRYSGLEMCGGPASNHPYSVPTE